MQTPDSISPAGQPAGAANPGQDPGSGNGIRPGGVPPELADRLATVDPALAESVRSLIANQTEQFTKNQMRLMEDSRLADEVRRMTQQDPDFDRYLEAKRLDGTGDRGALAGYHRQRLEQMGFPLQSSPLTATPSPEPLGVPDNLSGSPPGATDNAPGAAPTITEARVRQMEEELAATRQEVRQTSDAVQNDRIREEARQYAENHLSDWQATLPLVQKVRLDHPGLSLEEARLIAIDRFNVEVSPTPTSEGIQQAPAGPPASGLGIPPPPVSAVANDLVSQRREDKVYSKQNMARGLRDAMHDAMRETGITIPP